MDSLEFEMEQYRALRAEIIRSMEDGNQIMGFGLAAVGLVVNAGAEELKGLFGFLIFSTILPLISILILSLWFAAQERTARASHFLSGIEVRIKNAMGMPAGPSWEAWLRSSDASGRARHFWSTERAAIGLFGLVVIGSLCFSISTGGDAVTTKEMLAVFALVVTVSLGFAFTLFGRYRQWKKWLSSAYVP